MKAKNINTSSIFLRELDDILDLNYSLYPEYKGKIKEFAYGKLEITLSSSQLKMANAVNENKVVNVKAGHGLGKSNFIAILHFYWVYVIGGQCVSTAPSFDQLMENIWNPINILWDKNKHNFEGECLTKELRHNNTARAYGRTARDYDLNSFQGKHTPNLLLIEDEACGITSPIDTGIKSCATGEGSKIFRAGNPVEPYTAFYYNCLSSSITLTVFDHVNVFWAYEIRPKESPYHRLKKDVYENIFTFNANGKIVIKNSNDWPIEYPRYPIQGAVDIQWIEDMRSDFGEGSIEWLGRVEAKFPISVSNGVVNIPKLRLCRSYSSLERALSRVYTITIGLDIGGGSDPHCIAYARGNNFLDYKLVPTFNDGDDLKRLGEELIDYLRDIPDIENIEQIQIGYDATGEGSGCENAIKNCIVGTEFEKRIKFYRIKTGSASSDKMIYVSLKAEQLGTFALNVLQNEFKIFLTDEQYELFEQEIAFITKSYSSRNRAMQVISKEDYKKKTGKSHDITDALMMAFSIVNDLVESKDNKQDEEKQKVLSMIKRRK
jgi:hypothetical protein